ncbi:MAG: hypothetical protein ABUL47_07925, partial [Leifsonia sp.]
MNARRSAVAAVLLLAFGVTGCTAQGQVTTGTPKPPATAAPAPGSQTTTGTGTPMVYPCDQLVDAQTLAKLDSGLTADSVTAPAAGSPAAEAIALQGTSCSWSDAGSQTTLSVSVALPDAATFDSLKTKASAGTLDGEFGSFVTAYTDGNGEVQLFTTDGSWAVLDSPLMLDDANRSLLGQAVVMAL